MAKKKETKLWFEGEKTYNIIFTDEDLRTVLSALEKLSAGHFAEKQNSNI